jgi:hypothetical protein
VLVDWTDDFERALERLDERAERGDDDARLVRELVDAQLAVLQRLDGEPTEETMVLRRVARSGKYPVWRVSHPFIAGTAVRTIAWFKPDGSVVVALFFNNKAPMGDVFYSSVGSRADQAIHRFLLQTEGEAP